MARTKFRKILVLCFGWLFVLLGILGLFLPFLQGILFLLIGLILLSTEYDWARRLLEKIRGRFPKLSHRLDEAAHRANLWLHRHRAE